jgi:hypothetical protein
MSRKSELYAVVADLAALRYGNASIARALVLCGCPCTARRIQQIVDDLGLTPPIIRTLADIPAGFSERIESVPNR